MQLRTRLVDHRPGHPEHGDLPAGDSPLKSSHQEAPDKPKVRALLQDPGLHGVDMPRGVEGVSPRS